MRRYWHAIDTTSTSQMEYQYIHFRGGSTTQIIYLFITLCVRPFSPSLSLSLALLMYGNRTDTHTWGTYNVVWLHRRFCNLSKCLNEIFQLNRSIDGTQAFITAAHTSHLRLVRSYFAFLPKACTSHIHPKMTHKRKRRPTLTQRGKKKT